MQRGKVIILEDAIFVREMEKKFLRGLGFTTFVETNSEEEAVQQMGSNHFDLAIIDLHIPEGSGEGAIQKIRKLDKNIKIAVITSFPEKLEKMKEVVAMANCLLSKPFTEKEFQAKITEVLHG